MDKLKEPSAIIANKFLQDENAKLREQLIEWQALYYSAMDANPSLTVIDAAEELNTLLAQAREEGRKEATAKLKHVCNLWIDPDTAEIIVDRCDHKPSECTPAYITEWVKLP